MKLRTKALAAAGAVPLLLGGVTPAQAADPVSETRTFSFSRSGEQVNCTYTGTSHVFLTFDSGSPRTQIDAATFLSDNDPACRFGGLASTIVRYRRDQESGFDQVSAGELDDYSAGVALIIEGPVIDVDVQHTATYECGAPRPCFFSFTTNPK
jgi:hypothetical protein